MQIYYDKLQEGHWFQGLDARLAASELLRITGAVEGNPGLAGVLAYDRPDVILADGGQPILMVERTAEVPSGHNVGQRFARKAAAAQCRVPVLYICPYAARKHGGATAGPRYMNLRLFYALDHMARIEGTSIEIVNWPVDARHEVIHGPAKNVRVKDYLGAFFTLYGQGGVAAVNSGMAGTSLHQQQMAERARFISGLKRADRYDGPPPGVTIGSVQNLAPLRGVAGTKRLPHTDTVLYRVGMRKIRSDPYTGMGMLYEYLYAGGASRQARTRNLVFHFPHVTIASWRQAAGGRARKDIRLFTKVADGIRFSDGFLLAEQLAPAPAGNSR